MNESRMPLVQLPAPDEREGSVPNGDAERTLGVYVHFPWCLKKCGYCDFLSVPSEPGAVPHEPYADAVISELERRERDLEGGLRLTSVYFGGGTPSLWSPRALGRVLGRVRRGFAVSSDVEVTVECNPSSFDGARARALLDLGVNRVSIGVQGLDDARLRWLGRLHDARGGLRAVEHALEAGFERVSADLIFGLPGQTAASAAREAAELAGTGVGHLSSYALTIEPGTAFGRLAKRKLLPIAREDDVADAFLALDAELERRGFEHYEISNYARSGQRSLHNMGYWRGAEYLGLGAGAWGTLLPSQATKGSRRPRIRYRNTPSPAHYLESRGRWASIDPLSIDAVGPVDSTEIIDGQTALRERLLLGLRLAEGVDLDVAGRELGVEPWTPARRGAARRLIADGRLAREGGVLKIPKGAWLLADGTIAELM